MFQADYKIAKKRLYDQCGFDLTHYEQNSEGTEYGACSFLLAGKKVQKRFSKITPTKAGQFVAIWKRNQDGGTCPFEYRDLDFIIIAARCGDNFGEFIFPRSVLADHGIITVKASSVSAGSGFTRRGTSFPVGRLQKHNNGSANIF